MNRQFEVDKYGVIQGWFCKTHNLFNDILTNPCNYCSELRPESLELHSHEVRIKRLGLTIMSAENDLFIKLFGQEKLLVKSLDTIALRSRKDELRLIINEAKARIAAVDDEERERVSKLSAKQKSWLQTDSSVDPTVSDAISAIKERKKRMNAADKLAESLKSLGIEGDEHKTMMANVERKQTSQSVSSSSTRKLTDKRPLDFSFVKKSVDTQNSLLADISKNIVDGIHTRPVEDLVKATTTAGHIANKILNSQNGSVIVEKLELIEEPKKKFDLSFLKKK